MVSEAIHTPARPDVPHPEYWHAPADGDSTEHEVSLLVGALVRALQPELVVETGTAFGFTAIEIGRALHANGHGRLVTLEVNPARLFHACSALQDLHSYVEVRRQSSLEYAPDQAIDLAWFDSLPNLRAQEFLHYRQLGKLNPGAIVGFHDTAPTAAGGGGRQVRADVEALQDQAHLRAIYLPTPRGVALAEVTKGR